MSKRNVLKRKFVYFLVILFGLGSWTNIAGLWVELPVIVRVLPESWQLPSKLTLIINAANFIPIVVVFSSFVFKFNTFHVELPLNFLLLSLSLVFSLCFAFLWEKTSSIFGDEQSLSLMILSFFCAVSDCLSSTTFIPFLNRYEPIFLNAYFTGEALTSLLPALLAIGQGVSSFECRNFRPEIIAEPNFSVRIFFLILSILPISAFVSFSLLCSMKTGRTKVPTRSPKKKRIFIVLEHRGDLRSIEQTIDQIEQIEENLHSTNRNRIPVTRQTVFLVFIVFHSSALLFGFCQGLTTFSLNAYSSQTFHWTLIASQFSYPLVTLLAIFVRQVSLKTIYGLYAATVGLFLYIFVTAKMSPCPPLSDRFLGSLIIFSVWILIHSTGSALRIFLGNYFREKFGHSGLVLFGLSTQIGALSGASIVFLLSNVLTIFKERNFCDPNSICV